MDIFHTTKEFIHSNVGSIPDPVLYSLRCTPMWLVIFEIYWICFYLIRRRSQRDPGLHRAVKHLDRLLPRVAFPLLFVIATSSILFRYFVVAALLCCISLMLLVGVLRWYCQTYCAIVVRYRAQKEWNKGELWVLYYEKFEDLEPGNTWAPVGKVQGGESKEGTDISSPYVVDAQSPNAAHINQ